MTTHLTGAITAEWYTLEYREVPEDPKSDDTNWTLVSGTTPFQAPQDAIDAAAPLNEQGFQTRIIIHRMISTELMRFF